MLIYKYAIVRSHPRRGLRWNVPLVLRRSFRILEKTNPRINRELHKQRFAQGSINTNISTAPLFLTGLRDLRDLVRLPRDVDFGH